MYCQTSTLAQADEIHTFVVRKPETRRLNRPKPYYGLVLELELRAAGATSSEV